MPRELAELRGYLRCQTLQIQQTAVEPETRQALFSRYLIPVDERCTFGPFGEELGPVVLRVLQARRATMDAMERAFLEDLGLEFRDRDESQDDGASSEKLEDR